MRDRDKKNPHKTLIKVLESINNRTEIVWSGNSNAKAGYQAKSVVVARVGENCVIESGEGLISLRRGIIWKVYEHKDDHKRT